MHGPQPSCGTAEAGRGENKLAFKWHQTQTGNIYFGSQGKVPFSSPGFSSMTGLLLCTWTYWSESSIEKEKTLLLCLALVVMGVCFRHLFLLCPSVWGPGIDSASAWYLPNVFMRWQLG